MIPFWFRCAFASSLLVSALAMACRCDTETRSDRRVCGLLLGQGMGHEVCHPVKGHARAVFGRGQIIRRDEETGLLSCGSDSRGDGQAICSCY